MTDEPSEDPYATPQGWSPGAQPAPPAPPRDGPPDWQPPPPPYAAPPGWQPPPPPYAAPPGWQPQPPPYAAPPGWQPPPPPYGAPPGYPQYGYPAPGNTSGFAIASLVCSILGGLFVPFIGGIVGIVFGVVGLRHCARNNEGGRGMAIAGIIIGGVAVFFWLLVSIGLAVGDVHSQSHHHSTDLGTLILPGLLPW